MYDLALKCEAFQVLEWNDNQVGILRPNDRHVVTIFVKFK